MSKRKKKADQQKKSLSLLRSRRTLAIGLSIAIGLGLVVGILAQLRGFRSATRMNLNPASAPAGLAPNALSKEYIYAGSRLLATDEPGTQTTSLTENVIWTHLVGMTASGNSLTKSAPLSIWDSGAASTRGIASGDGYVEFTAGENTSHKMLGLTFGDDSVSYGDIDFALYPQNSGYLYVYEGGAQIGNFGTYVSGDRLRVAVESGVVKYQKWTNGDWTVIYTSSKPPRYPMLVDSAFYTPGSTINNVVIAGTLQEVFPPIPQTENVAWKNAVGVSASGNNLTRSANPDGWNAGAASTRAIASGNGYVEFTVDGGGTYKYCGLSNGDTSQSYVDIDFAIYAHANGSLQIYESGVWKKDPARSYQPGDLLKVSVENGVVKYWQNNQLLWTSPTTPKYPLLVDTSLYNGTAAIKNAVISGVLQ